MEPRASRRAARGLPIGYDPRMGRVHSGPPSEQGDEPYPPPMSDSLQIHQHSPYADSASQHYRLGASTGYRGARGLPHAYRTGLKETTSSTPSLYKILCITNINPKVSDEAVKEGLVDDFNQFGDISVSICHDSGERLAYIYFRTYKEARGARHAKSKTILFDRPIDIEPIYDPHESSVDSQPSPPIMQPTQPYQLSQNYYPRRRSPTPPEYYLSGGDRRLMHSYPAPLQSQHTMQRGRSPPPGYPMHMHPRHPNSLHSPPHPLMHPIPATDRYYIHPMHMAGPLSPYSSPPRELHDQYRSYPPHPHFMTPNYGLESMYLPQNGPYRQPPPYPSMMRPEGEKPINELHVTRSPSPPPPHDPYYHIEHRGYPSAMVAGHQSSSTMHPSRSSLFSAGLNHQSLHPSAMEHQTCSSRRMAPDHPVRYMSREFRREKYGSENYSNENDEGRPSRVLFVNNIDSSKSEEDLRVVFSPFGKIDELELRQVSAETSSALVKYSSMDCAYKAKTATNGKYIGKLKCRITYSRVSASRRLWIGGLGTNTTVSSLEDEFGRYGTVIDMDYTSGRPYAYVEFVTANQAQFATHHLRGTFLAEAERRIRIEYVDPLDRNNKSKPELNTQSNINNTSSRSRLSTKLKTNDRDTKTELQQTPRKRSTTPTDINVKRFTFNSKSDQTSRAVSNTIQTDVKSRSNSPLENKSSISDKELNNNQEIIAEKDGESLSISTNISTSEKSIFISEIDLERIILAKNIKEILSCCSVKWSSQLVLRNFNFPSTIHMCSGRKSTIKKYLNSCVEKTNDNCFVLRINQRWRLHPQPKLEEVTRRMQSANSGILIITSRQGQSPTISSPSCRPTTSSSVQIGEQQEPTVNSNNKTNVDHNTKTSESTTTQSRPLKNLISYLEQKNAAGVISLNALESDHSDDSKLLYAFPPGKFVLNLLKRVSPNFNYDSNKEEFLLGVIIGGGESKI